MTLPLDTSQVGLETQRVFDVIAQSYPVRTVGILIESTAVGDETTTSTTYADLGTVGPVLTIPTQGLWEIEIGCMAFHSVAAAAVFMSYSIGATAAVDADAAYRGQAVGNTDVDLLRRIKRKTLAAGTVLTCKYKSPSGATTTVRNAVGQPRYIKATLVG